MPKVIFFTNLAPETASLLTRHAPPDYAVETYSAKLTDAEKKTLTADADFLILFPPIIDAGTLKAARKLRLIQLVSAGFDKLDMDLCRSLGIPVANNGGSNSVDVAEHTLMFILILYRRLIEMDDNVRAGKWNVIDSGASTYTIYNKTIGIIGLGKIGKRVATLLRPFGATVIYFDPFPAPPDVEASLGVERVSMDELLQRSDVVTLHVPLDTGSRALIGERELALMKPSALLINTCRGPVIDEPALTKALAEKRIGGAGLDVLHDEPPAVDNPLFSLDNVILTPHTAGVTHDTWSRRGEFIFENLRRVWGGQPPLATVQ